jgi:hypothetical protein
MKLPFKVLALCLVASLHSPLMAQKGKLPEQVVSKQEAEKHLRYLADDALMGRKTGTPGNDSAAHYIARQFKAYGLTPLPGQNSFMQPIELALISPSPNTYCIVAGDTLRNGKDLVSLSKSTFDGSAPLVLAGFGLAEDGLDDYKDLDVKGKIVVVRVGSPSSKGPMQEMQLAGRKRELAKQKGAVGLIELYQSPFPWQQIAGYFSGAKYEVVKKEKGEENGIAHIWTNHERFKKMLSEGSATPTAHIFIPEPVIKKLPSQNVAGMVQGHDRKLRQEYVILSAHYDHVGTGMRAGAGASEEDTIFNGARDNAMGTVALLTAAKAMAKQKPARSVIFLALTGEEIGMIGSSYYAENPLVPLNKTVFALNADGAGYNDTTLVTVIGLDRTSAEPLLRQAASDVGLKAITDPVPEQNLFDRSDNVSFAKKGIPAPNFAPGMSAFDDEIMKYYHNAKDEADTMNFDYLIKYSRAFARAGRLIADHKGTHTWRKGDKYEEAGHTLYGTAQ